LAIETFEVAANSFDERLSGSDKVNLIVTNLNVLALNATLKNLKASNEVVNTDRAISSGEASSLDTRDHQPETIHAGKAGWRLGRQR